MTPAVPTFVVVGNVNQGKSSIVATLAEEESVPIDATPGTTTRSGEYVFAVNGQPVFKLVDTPGFQDARWALAWMKERALSAADHKRAVEAFLREFQEEKRFQDEVRLLRPILGGASVLYVVDASSRFQPSNEAEMEILRWTGQTGMALVNRTKQRDFGDEWRPILEQFFNVVRTFNAHDAGFAERIDLLRSFRELREDWRPAMDAAITSLETEWSARLRRSAAILTDEISAALTHVEKRRVEGQLPDPELREALRKSYEEALRKLESRARSDVETTFRHATLKRDDQALQILESDLFSETSWRLFGLSRTQLAQYGAAWGGAIGGAVDLMVGGLSFFAGVLIGAATGGLAGYFGGTKIAATFGEKSKLARRLFPTETGRILCMGPVTNPGFAWMLLDRALVHFRAVRDLAHARRAPLSLDDHSSEKRGIVAELPSPLRDGADRAFRACAKAALSGKQDLGAEDALRTSLLSILEALPRSKSP